jgi:hypothetical protein
VGRGGLVERLDQSERSHWYPRAGAAVGRRRISPEYDIVGPAISATTDTPSPPQGSLVPSNSSSVA